MKQYNIDSTISRSEFRTLVNISRSHEWRLLKAGMLPATVIVNGRILGYRQSAYLEWLDNHTSR